MKNHFTTESPQPETNRPQETVSSETKDLDIDSRKWRRRFTAIRESPMRVVLLAGLIFFCLMLFPIVTGTIQEGQPLEATLWNILGLSTCMISLIIVIGLMLSPFVLLAHIIAIIRHRRRIQKGGETRSPVVQNAPQSTQVKSVAPFQERPSQISDQEHPI